MATKEKWRRQNLRGRYEDFDPSKLLPGEIAFITSGDPNSVSGRSVYACFEAGIVKRFTTYEDFETELQNATADVQAAFTEEIRNTIDSAIIATNAANTAMEAANAAAKAANEAAEAAGAYVLGDMSEKTVTFERASERVLPASGENLAILFGKVTKYLADLAAGAVSSVLGTNLPANKAVVSDANGKIGESEVTATELGYLAGTTSKVQDQLNALNTNLATEYTWTNASAQSGISNHNIEGVNICMQFGVTEQTSSVSSTIYIEFPKPYTKAPVVLANSFYVKEGMAATFVTIANTSEKGVTLLINNLNGGIANSVARIHWLAIGQLA